MSDDVRAARDTALGLLARREHSRAELARKLARKGHPSVAVEQALMALAEADLLSDRRFATGYAEQRAERGFGPVAIRAALRERGVSGELAELALASVEGAWRERCERARRGKFGAGRPADRRAWLRQAQFLARRGFAESEIRAILDDRHD